MTAPRRVAGRHLAALVLASGLVLTACSNGDDTTGEPTETQGPLPTLPSSDPTASETPTSEPTETTESLTPEQQADADAKAAIVGYFQAMDRVLQDPENYDPLVEARDVAASTAMSELTLLRERQLTAGLRSEGGFVVESMDVVKADYTGEDQGLPTLEIATCFSSRDIVFFEGDQKVDDLADAPSEGSIYGVSYYDTEEPAGWRVMYHRPFDAENPTC